MTKKILFLLALFVGLVFPQHVTKISKTNKISNVKYFNGFETYSDWNACYKSDYDGKSWTLESGDDAHTGTGFAKAINSPISDNEVYEIWFPEHLWLGEATTIDFWAKTLSSVTDVKVRISLMVLNSDSSFFDSHFVSAIGYWEVNNKKLSEEWEKYSFTDHGDYPGKFVLWIIEVIPDQTILDNGMLLDDVEITYLGNISDINIVHPNGGEKFQLENNFDTQYNIGWESINVNSAKIEYSTDGSNGPWKMIVPDVPSNVSNSVYSWRIPNDPSDECYIRITDNDNGTFDITDNSFSIIPPILDDRVRYDRIEFYENVIFSNQNINNFIDPSLPIRFKVRVMNTLTQNILAGKAYLTTNNPLVTITDNLANINNLLSGKVGWTVDEFEIIVDTTIQPGSKLVFNLRIEQSFEPKGPWDSQISFPIHPLLPNELYLDDDNNPDSKGNGNGIIEYGETIEIIPFIDNITDNTFYNISCGLQSNSFVNVWDNINGSSGLVFNTWKYNYSSSTHNPITPFQQQVQPEQDYVFDYLGEIAQKFNCVIRFEGYFEGYKNNINWDQDGIKMMWTSTLNFNENVTTISEEKQIPKTISLSQNYPNPFNPVTIIQFTLNKSEHVVLEIYNSFGELVKTLINKTMVAGFHNVEFDARQLSSGVYYYRLKANEFRETKKMLFLK